MALWIVGLGLYDSDDVTVKGRRAVRQADRVYAEFYTARLVGSDHAALEEALGTSIDLLGRQGVEEGAQGLVEEARRLDVALLTAGDPLSATTHTDLVLRARRAGVPVHVVHGTSIFTAAPGLLGLQVYKFGRATTLVRPQGDWAPDSPFAPIEENLAAGLHTLVLLDIQAHEDYFMTAGEGMELLLSMAQRRGADFGPDRPVGVVARAGSDAPLACTGPIGELLDRDFGPPLHTLVVPGQMQVVEQEMWDELSIARV